MTTQDKVKVIAEYDTERLHFGKTYKQWLKSIGNLPPDVNKYLTSLDWLHPVAMKVMDELRGLEYSGDMSHTIYTIRQYCATKPINGEYIDLLNAVYDGIVFLNSNK